MIGLFLAVLLAIVAASGIASRNATAATGESGLCVLFEVDLDSAHAERLNGVEIAVRRALLEAEPRIGYMGLRSDETAVSFALEDEDDRARAVDVLRALGPDVQIELDEAGAGHITFEPVAETELDALIVRRTAERLRFQADISDVSTATIRVAGTSRISAELHGIAELDGLWTVIVDSFGISIRRIIDPQLASYDRLDLTDAELLPVSGSGQRLAVERQILAGEQDFAFAEGVARDEEWIVSVRLATTAVRVFSDLVADQNGEPVALVSDGLVIAIARMALSSDGRVMDFDGDFNAEDAQRVVKWVNTHPGSARIDVIDQWAFGPGTPYETGCEF